MIIKSRKIRVLLLTSLLLVLLYMAIGFSQTTPSKTPVNSDDIEMKVYSQHEMLFSREPIRHLILYKKSRKYTPDNLEIGVLVGGKDFSVDNLRKLAEFLHTKFPKPQYLSIEVYSDFQTAILPEEWTIPSEVLASEEGKNRMFRRALIMRDLDDNRWFSYDPYDGAKNRKAVVLKGCTPRKELCVDKKMQRE